ncbi:alpha/beta hydrolase [Frigoribacterium sp. CFBP 8759]|uniref:alpha/beta fold hydrolase n=1 Tax=unclassified Frigoribacterium TaxID=2627005 RepID=UPI000F494CE7|nr:MULTISPECIES: alpha/beta hydrolase [unclassified Frigoribacterium]MBD8141006.1 alpha/beta hydrolase [Frigoribacterium sp. CFBP 13605]MBD8484091.1 alpha/beta hydrolase [Frigoribacterium sp. CFBP 8759]ROS50104.1 pimeloyl-ACP methyl ester carboxylesterase [Frigoribacterium sp. PhB118]
MRRGRATGVADPTLDRYAPFALVTEPGALGLTRSTIETAHGRTVVHHATASADRSSRRRATVLLHGAAGSWTTWTPLLQAAREVDAVVSRPVLIDLPGWGASPEPDPGLDVESAAAVVVEVAEALGVTEFDLVGHSMGAFVALHLAAVRPDLVLSVSVVSATSFSAIDAVTHPVRGLVRLPAFTLLRAAFGVLPRASASLLRGAARIGLLRTLSSPVFRHVDRVPRSVLEAFVAELRPRGFLAASRSGQGYDATRWRGIECDVAAVSGADDVFARSSDLDRLADVVRHARTTLLADCGHFAHVERPHETLRALGWVEG